MTAKKQCLCIFYGEEVYYRRRPPFSELTGIYVERNPSGINICTHWPLGRLEEISLSGQPFQSFLGKLRRLYQAGVRILLSQDLKQLFCDRKLSTEADLAIRNIYSVISKVRSLQTLSGATVIEAAACTEELPHTVRGEVERARMIRKHDIPECYMCTLMEKIVLKPHAIFGGEQQMLY